MSQNLKKVKRYIITSRMAVNKDWPITFVAATLKETSKAVYLYGHGELNPQGKCARCGRTLTHPGSILIGVGPECLGNWNLRDVILNNITGDDIKRFHQFITDKKVDGWLPKYSIQKEEPWGEEIYIPKKHPLLNSSTTQKEKSAQLVQNNEKKPHIKITFPYNKDDLAHVKSLSGRKFHGSQWPKFWTCSLKVDSVESLKWWGFKLDQALETFLEKKKLHVNQVEEIQIPGLGGKLFPFQKKGVAFIEAKDGRALIADEMGLGKTVQALAWLQLHPEKRPAVIVVPASLKLNWEREAHAWMDNPKTQVLSGTKAKEDLTGDIIIINYDILSAWVGKLRQYNAQVLITDECFPASTKISTPKGKINIENIKEGDKVYNATGIGTVLKIGKRKTKKLIKLHLSNNKQIIVTPNHPFLTETGWVEAQKLQGKKLLTSSDIFNIMVNNSILKNKEGGQNEKNKENMPCMSSTIQNECMESKVLQQSMCYQIPQQQKTIPQKMQMVRTRFQNRHTSTEILREILLSEMEEHITANQSNTTISRKKTETKPGNEKSTSTQPRNSKTSFTKNEGKQSLDPPRSNEENKRTLETIWASFTKTATKGRKWSSTTKSAKNIMRSFRNRMGARIPCKNQTKKGLFWISNMLQGRFSTPKEKNMDRSRWMGASIAGNTETRSKENRTFETIRVERIEILERPDRKQSTESVVYNLKVSGHPSYYAEGFLVHNCHFYKSNTAKRTKAIKMLGKKIPHVIALSGTPVVNRPVEMFNAMKLVDDTAVPNFWTYAQRYCGAKHNGFGWDFSGASHTEELHEKLVNTVMLRRLKKDVLKDLPEKIHSILPIEIDNPTEYIHAEGDLIAWIRKNRGKGAAEKASNAEAFAQIEVLKQLAIKGKMKQAIEWIENFLDIDGKLVVFATHKNTIDVLMQKFGNRAVKIDGSVSEQARQDAVDKFQNDETYRLFVGNIKAAGVGITLTAASNVAFLELPWTPGELSQAEDRCHRIGQKNTVNVYYLIASNTIDEKIARMLDIKRKVLDSVLDGKETEQESLLSTLINEYKE